MGWSAGGNDIGSGNTTSNPAAKIFPLLRASQRSSTFTISPLAILIKTAFDFIFENTSALNIFLVSGVSGQIMNMKSLFLDNSSNETNFAPISWASGFSLWPQYRISLTSKAKSFFAKQKPIFPKPTIPIVEFLRSCPIK